VVLEEQVGIQIMSSPDFAKLESRLKHIVIEAVTPNVDSGRFAVKRIVGEDCVVEADIFRDGPAALAAVVKWRRAGDSDFSEARMEHIENDRWHGKFPLLENTGYVFTIEAWTRSFHSWREYYLKKVAAGMNITSDVSEGIALLNGMKQHAPYEDSLLLAESIEQLRAIGDSPMGADIVVTAGLESAVDRNEDRADRTLYDILLPVTADRPLARFSAWYEIFPRSQGTRAGEHATLREAEERLSDIKDMGFDVVYVAPVHPIGATHRKGPNNSLVAEPDSPGSPWAIGSRAGGHTAVEPLLGTLDDFDHFVLVAGRLGLEIALDLAIQCSPDHPWVIEHPSWFRHRPDGSIKFAENPPKQYQDIYPIDFDSSDQADLIDELLNVVLFWISHGVRIFRVDNPHTKPVAFW
jgi:starch synthase (maltosyl-transferring)